MMLRSCPKNFGIFLYHGMGVSAGWANELLKEGYYIFAEKKQKAGSRREFTNYLKTSVDNSRPCDITESSVMNHRPH